MGSARISEPSPLRGATPGPLRAYAHRTTVETRLLGIRAGFMNLEIDEGKVLSFPFEDAGTERACRSGLERGEVVVVLEMRDDVPLKVVGIRDGARPRRTI